MDAVPYKQFYIVVRVTKDRHFERRFDIFLEIRRGKQAETVNVRLTSKPFDSETMAYEFGLQQGRAWIDKHEHD